MSRVDAVKVGDVHGKLTITAIWTSPKGRMADCICECGAARENVWMRNLYNGNTYCCKGCGLSAKTASKTIHGHSRGSGESSEYQSWCHLIGRCCNPIDSAYESYGGRGITVFDEWRSSFTAFLQYVGLKPTPSHSIDRWPDKNGNYEPGNVRWATPKEQANNTRTNVVISHNGLTMTASEWARSIDVSSQTIINRLAAGWPVERVVTEPSRNRKIQQ